MTDLVADLRDRYRLDSNELRHLAADRIEALEAATTLDWQPIETAPKDDIIVLTDGGALWQGFWQQGLGWLTGYSNGAIDVRITLNPTHWAPLPKGPKPSEALDE